jgi:hypothetical protein
MAGKLRADKNSTTAMVKSFQDAGEVIPVPKGVVLKTDQELLLWEQFSHARARSDWRDMDLILLAKVVKLEADIRKYQATLDAEGVMMENKRGTMVCNPLVSVIDTLERRQMAIIRSMSLNQTHTDARTINANAKTQSGTKDIMSMFSDTSLIPMPASANQ